MLRNARIDAEWIAPPAPRRSAPRTASACSQHAPTPIEPDEEDRELAEQLMAELTPEAIAAALVRSLRTDLPAPEDILAAGARDERGDRAHRARASTARSGSG